ncbi:MAG: hypothetical protein EOL98_08620 [Negativicutes bacterium]|nr:hypothetical protein [Negativicutes bacterium]
MGSKVLEFSTETKDSRIYTDSLILDGKNIGKMDFYCFDFTEPAVDGFLGYNFLTKYKVFLDFTKDIMYIKK